MEDALPFEKRNPKTLVKRESSSAPSLGCPPLLRDLSTHIAFGMINLNKPSGPTSHQVADYVRKILGIKKVSHGGTLDPHVTGVLPIALEKSARIVQALLPAGKEYIALMYLHKDVSQQQLDSVLEKFMGKITQLPPRKSAVKRAFREREVYYLRLLEKKERYCLIKIGCQGGTYARKLIHDIGKELKVGAHMKQLVRTKAGPFTDKNWHSLQDLKDAFEFAKEGREEQLRQIILPFEAAVSHLPKIWVLDSCINALCHGSPLAIPGISKLHDDIKKEDSIAIMSLKEELVCLATAALSSQEIEKLERGIAANVSKVFMAPESYPNPMKAK